MSAEAAVRLVGRTPTSGRQPMAASQAPANCCEPSGSSSISLGSSNSSNGSGSSTSEASTTSYLHQQQHQAAAHELSIISQPIVIGAAVVEQPPAPFALASPAPHLPPGAGRPNQHGQNNQQWMMVAAQTTQGMRHRMSLASDQLGLSLRQLYASASSITDMPPSYHNIPGIVPYYHGRSSGPPPSYDDVINPYAPPPTYQSLFGQMREARKSSRGLLDLLQRLLIILISTLGCTILIAFMILIPFTMIIVGAVYIDECRVEHIPAFLLVGGLVWASKNIIHCYAQCQQPGSSSSSTSGSSSGSSSGSTSGPGNSSNGFHNQDPPSDFTSAFQQQQQNLTSYPVGATTTHRTSDNNHQRQQQSRRLKSSICESLLNCVLFGWFIAGCVIVFRNYEPDFDNTDSARYCHRTVYMYTFWLITSAIIIFGLFTGCICCLMVSSAIASRQEDDIA